MDKFYQRSDIDQMRREKIGVFGKVTQRREERNEGSVASECQKKNVGSFRKFVRIS